VMETLSNFDHLKDLVSKFGHNPVLRLHYKSEAGRVLRKQGGDPTTLRDKDECGHCCARGMVKTKSNGKKGNNKKVMALCLVCGKPRLDLKPIAIGSGAFRLKQLKFDEKPSEEDTKPEVSQPPKPSNVTKPNKPLSDEAKQTKSVKKKAKKDVNAGLIIPPKKPLEGTGKKTTQKFNSNKLAKMLQTSSGSSRSQDRLKQMLI